MDYEEARAGLSLLFDRNPAYGDIYAAAIDACIDEIGEADAIAAVDAQKTSRAQTQDAESILATLIRRGGIECAAFVDGERYSGTPQDLQDDDTLGDDVEIAFSLHSTRAGIDAAAAYRDSKSIGRLLAESPEHREGFLCAIKACASDEGASTSDVQRALIDEGIIQPGVASAQTIHASYFTSKLERYGALVWEGKRWHATEEGLAAMNVSEEG